MNLSGIIRKNTACFVRYYRLVAVAAMITVAVIAGSLVVGDSVRATLVRRVAERIGDTETILFSRNSFISEELLNASVFEGAKGILLTNGFISRNGRLIPVYVWGVDHISVPRRGSLINGTLAEELGNIGGEDIVLRLPATGLVPSGSLFVTRNYTTSLRLALNGHATIEQGGNISLKNEQAIPYNIFLNREELAEAMEIEGKINLILSDRSITQDDLDAAWSHEVSGLSADSFDGYTEIVSDRVFIPSEVTETILQDNRGTRLFSYLANSISTDETSIPYSFITAAESYKGRVLRSDEILLSDYSASRLGAKPGDMIKLTYYRSEDLKRLVTDSVMLRVGYILPLRELAEDGRLSADFPGLSDVERCTDWDSDIPIDMSLIKEEDEDYWSRYRTTPKAIIAYEAVAGGWSNPYGNATALRLSGAKPDLSGLNAKMFGMQLIYPREPGMLAAVSGVDFSALFLALGFFIIISAMLLMVTPLSEMFFRRREEIELLKALGFAEKRIAMLLWRESLPVVSISSVMGIAIGLLYTMLVLWLLGNVWRGAAQTDGLLLSPSAPALLLSAAAGIGISLLLLWVAIRRSLKEGRAGARPNGVSPANKRRFAAVSITLALSAAAASMLLFKSTLLFVVAGALFLAAAALCGDYMVSSRRRPDRSGMNSDKLLWGRLYADRRQAMLSFLAIAIGVFVIFSVGLNRSGFGDSSKILSGTGGYALWCESSVPIYHDMNSEDGRERLALKDLPQSAEVLQCLRLGADDASCLNLNKVSTPTVLGIDMEAMAASSFRIEKSLLPGSGSGLFEAMRHRRGALYPALVDATVLTWSLGLSIGDTLRYEGGRGEEVGIIIVGTLSNSILQGNIVIDRGLFSEIWSGIDGSEIFLVEVEDPQVEETKTLLQQALNEYGVTVTSTGDRLMQFSAVADTYLTIFMTLGSIGLLLGITSLIVVVRKSLAMRSREIALYRTLGFRDESIAGALTRENLMVPLYAVAAGMAASVVGVGGSFTNTGPLIWLSALLTGSLLMLAVIVFVKRSVANAMAEPSNYRIT